MMYRNRTFQTRFKDSIAEYDSNDREQMLAYMNDHGFTSPKDVWFSNLSAFLEIDLEREQADWSKELKARVYPMDASWFLKNMDSSYLSICTTQDPDDEFLMTPNAYSIFEGPNDGNLYSDYHLFAPISPKLMLVTRSLLLPTGHSDRDNLTHLLFQAQKAFYTNPALAESNLIDLPIRLPENNYSRIVNGKPEPLPTKMAREKHKFNFSFFAITTVHVQPINTIFLEQAMDKEGIVFQSKPAFKRALEHYLATDLDGFKRVPRIHPRLATLLTPKQLEGIRFQQRRLPYLKLLEKVAHDDFGSNQEAVYVEFDAIRASIF